MIAKLSKVKNIIGVKDASADLVTPLKVSETFVALIFIQLSEDATFLAFLISGGSGCISVTANVVPKLCSANFLINGKKVEIKKCMEINKTLYPLNNVLFLKPVHAQ